MKEASAARGSPKSGQEAKTGVRAGVRVAVSAAAGVVTAAGLALGGLLSYAPAVGWDVAVLIFLGWVWRTVWPMDGDATAAHATREDPTRPISDLILLVASVLSLTAVGFFLLRAASAKGSTQDVLAAVGVATVALSWLLVHTVFTLRYAQLYYTGPDGGIDFNQPTPPRYSDFAYLAFTLGMTFQVSDTDLKTPPIRATALRHALLSYLFGAVILAATVNLVASLGTSK